MNYYNIKEDLESITTRKTKDIDLYNKKLIKNNVDVSFLADKILEDQLVHRTYFQVSLGKLKTYQEQFAFIDKSLNLLYDWWHVDQLMQFIHKPIDFSYAYSLANNYVNASETFTRRWGYVLFLMNLQKKESEVKKILLLIKNDDEYYVQMAEAWLLADMAIYQFDLVYIFLSESKIKYNIIGKAIQKMLDSFRIPRENKDVLRKLREKVKNN